jgi:hypothetical protein
VAIAVETVHTRFLNVVAGVGLDLAYPLFMEEDVQVFFGNANTPAILNVDYTVVMDPGDDFDSFQVVPTTSLIDKINDAIAMDATEANIVDVYRELDFLTDSTSPECRSTVFVTGEHDRTIMRLQQLKEKLSRAVLARLGYSGQFLPNPEPNQYIGWNNAGDALVNRVEVSFGVEVLPGVANTFLLRNPGNTAFLAVSDGEARLALVVGTHVADRASMKALNVVSERVAFLRSATEGDTFFWNSADLSSTLIRASLVPSAIDTGAETITFAAAHGQLTGDVMFSTATINGLTANTFYYVIKVSDTVIKLATTWANALAGVALNLTGNAAMTLHRHLDPKEGAYVIPTGKNINGSEGAWVRSTTKRVTPYMFGAVGNKGAGNTDDREALFHADEYCLQVLAKLDVNPDHHYVETVTSKVLVLNSVDYYFPWGDITLDATSLAYMRVITVAKDGARITLQNGTYESTIRAVGAFNYHDYIFRDGKGLRIIAENIGQAIWKTPIQIKNASDIFFTGVVFSLCNDQQLLNIADGTLYLDDCGSASPAGTRPGKIGGLLIARDANIFMRALTVNCVYDFSTCSGVITSPPYEPTDPALGLKVGDYLQINYSSTFWAAPSSTFYIRLVSGNTNGGGFITSITQGHMYLHNTSVEGTAKGDGSICVGVQRGAALRLVQDTAPDFALGLRNASTGVSLTGGSVVAIEGGANSGNDAFAVVNLTTGLSRTGGGVGSISYETAQVDFTGTTTPTSVSGAWTAV